MLEKAILQIVSNISHEYLLIQSNEMGFPR